MAVGCERGGGRDVARRGGGKETGGGAEFGSIVTHPVVPAVGEDEAAPQGALFLARLLDGLEAVGLGVCGRGGR